MIKETRISYLLYFFNNSRFKRGMKWRTHCTILICKNKDRKQEKRNAVITCAALLLNQGRTSWQSWTIYEKMSKSFVFICFHYWVNEVNKKRSYNGQIESNDWLNSFNSKRIRWSFKCIVVFIMSILLSTRRIVSGSQGLPHLWIGNSVRLYP